MNFSEQFLGDTLNELSTESGGCSIGVLKNSVECSDRLVEEFQRVIHGEALGIPKDISICNIN